MPFFNGPSRYIFFLSFEGICFKSSLVLETSFTSLHHESYSVKFAEMPPTFEFRIFNLKLLILLPRYSTKISIRTSFLKILIEPAQRSSRRGFLLS